MTKIKNYFAWLSEEKEEGFSAQLLKLLRDNKSNVDIRDVRELLHLGADPNYKLLGHSDEERIERMIDFAREEDLDLTEVPGVRIYKMATIAYPIFHRKSEVLNVMFEYGADPNLDFSDVSISGVSPTAFAYAIKQANTAYPSSMEIVDLFVRNGADVNFVDNKGNNLLHMAVEGSDFDVIPKLLEIGVDPNKKNANGKLPHEVINTWKEYDINGKVLRGSYVVDMIKDLIEKS